MKPAIPLLALSLSFSWQSCSIGQEKEPVLMEVHNIQAIPGKGAVAVILLEKEGNGYLPIFVDESQALSIYLGQKGEKATRPLTHDLMVDIFKKTNVKVNRIVVTDLREGVYYSEIELQQDKNIFRIDARPSDAIALALRQDTPIYAMPRILERAAEQDEASGPLTQMTVDEWGLTVQEIRGNLANYFGRTNGMLVAGVDSGSVASAAGLQEGDIITEIEGAELKDLAAFRRALKTARQNRQVALLILRDQAQQRVTLSKQE